jgi:hypothetical protein
MGVNICAKLLILMLLPPTGMPGFTLRAHDGRQRSGPFQLRRTQLLTHVDEMTSQYFQLQAPIQALGFLEHTDEGRNAQLLTSA